jgi:ribose transport system permease protein
LDNIDNSASPEMANHAQDKPRLRISGFNEFAILLVLVILVAIITIIRPSFFSIATFGNIGQRAALYGIMAVGTVYLLSMGEIDLSIGSTYAVSIASAAVLMVTYGTDPWLAALLGIVVGMVLGAINGLLANLFNIPAIIITLGTLTMYRGLTLIVTKGTTVFGLPREHPFFTIFGSKPLNVPMAVWFFLLITALLTVIYRRTRYGFVVRAIGSNQEAARLSGISIPTIRLLTLTMVGGLSALSGMLTLAFFATADPNLGNGYELLAIAAAIIGGTGLSGGSGTVPGALIGAFMIAVISSGIVQFGVSANLSSFVTGAMIVAAVALDAVIRQRQTAGS